MNARIFHLSHLLNAYIWGVSGGNAGDFLSANIYRDRLCIGLNGTAKVFARAANAYFGKCRHSVTQYFSDRRLLTYLANSA
ncbi:hypothetical protein HC928_05870 [bacterium]|nr:hypothetical protein [bacterium]